MSHSPWPPTWTFDVALAAAQAQHDALAAALLPLGIGPSGRLQLPSVEIKETPDSLVVTAFLPGVTPQQVQVRATRRSLTFFGQRSPAYPPAWGYGGGLNYFQQTIDLPSPVQDQAMEVAYCQGALVVTLPKQRGIFTWLNRFPISPWRRSLVDRWVQSWRGLRHWAGQRLGQWSDYLLTDASHRV
jgi:HSP20 family protein